MTNQARAKAVRALKALINVPRPDAQSTAPKIFHFGILPAGFLDGKYDRPVEEHRSIALVMAAVLEQALEGALLAKLPGIKAGNEAYLFSVDGAPLRDFDSKIRIAFGLELIGEGARSDLSLIRTVRNTFAHSRLDISFNTPEVAEACAHFNLQKREPNFVSSHNACQTFIDVGWEYAINLIVVEEDRGELDNHSRKILDLPHLSYDWRSYT
jgi:hypothetical protein